MRWCSLVIEQGINLGLSLFMVVAVVAFLVALVRLVYVLNTNPVGELAPEVLYLRLHDLRLPLFLALGILGVKAIELVLPILGNQRILDNPAGVAFILNAVQAGLLLAASLTLLRFLNRYSARSLEARIVRNMERIASLQSQKRRVSRLQEPDRSDGD